MAHVVDKNGNLKKRDGAEYIGLTVKLDDNNSVADDISTIDLKIADGFVVDEPQQGIARIGINAFTGDTGTGGKKGVVPAPAAGDAAAKKFLGAAGTWNQLPLFTGATANTPGTPGTVPAPAAGDNVAGKFLSADGTWQTPVRSSTAIAECRLSASSTTSVPTGDVVSSTLYLLRHSGKYLALLNNGIWTPRQVPLTGVQIKSYIQFTATLTTGSTTASGIDPFTSNFLCRGMPLTGVGIPTGAYLSNLNTTTGATITLSSAATANGAVMITAYYPYGMPGDVFAWWDEPSASIKLGIRPWAVAKSATTSITAGAAKTINGSGTVGTVVTIFSPETKVVDRCVITAYSSTNGTITLHYVANNHSNFFTYLPTRYSTWITDDGTSLDYPDGILTAPGLSNLRYLGTISIGDTGLFTDTSRYRYVWNLYNQVQRPLYYDNSADSHTYNSATTRRWGDQWAGFIGFIVGCGFGGELTEQTNSANILNIHMSALLKATSSTTYAAMYAYLNEGLSRPASYFKLYGAEDMVGSIYDSLYVTDGPYMLWAAEQAYAAAVCNFSGLIIGGDIWG